MLLSILDGEEDKEVKEKEPEDYEVERVVDYQFCKLEVLTCTYLYL